MLSHVRLFVTPWTSPPGSSVNGIFQARILEWVAKSSRGSSWPRNQTHVSCISCTWRWIFYHCATIVSTNGTLSLLKMQLQLGLNYWIHLNNEKIKVPKVRAMAKKTAHQWGKKSRKTADWLDGWECVVVSSRRCYVPGWLWKNRDKCCHLSNLIVGRKGTGWHMGGYDTKWWVGGGQFLYY